MTKNRIILLSGIILVLLMGVLLFKPMSQIIRLTSATIVSGNIEIKEGAKDPLFMIETESPILIRDVSYVEHRDGDFVLSNDSPNSDELASNVFYGEAYLDTYRLSDELLQIFTYDEYTLFQNPIEKGKVDELPTNNGNALGLVQYGDGYATAKNDWEAGDVVVRFSQPIIRGEYTAIGTVVDGELHGELMDVKTSREELIGQVISPYIVCLIGFVIGVLGILYGILKQTRKKNSSKQL